MAFLSLSGGSSHIAVETRPFLHDRYAHVRAFFTLAHASWLNQAELLLRAFSERYLKRGLQLVQRWSHARRNVIESKG